MTNMINFNILCPNPMSYLREKNDFEIKVRVPETLFLALSEIANDKDLSLGAYIRKLIEISTYGEAYVLSLREARRSRSPAESL